MQKNIQILTKKEIQQYIKDNCTKVRPGFWRVDTPLKVWKKTRVSTPRGTKRGIVALEIPVGATIHTSVFNGRENGSGEQTKMRANVAIVRNQCVVAGIPPWEVPGNSRAWLKEYQLKQGVEFQTTGETYSGHDPSFKYHTGVSVKPKEQHPQRAFDKHGACMSGIHFFVNLSEALNY